MKSFYKYTLLLLLIPALAVANNGKKGKYTKEKKLNKEFTVNATAGLLVDNSYGNIDIATWNENRTVIEVTITTNGDNEEKVQEKLDEITVEFSGNGSLVTAKTIFKNSKGSWSWWSNNKSNVNMEINYKIKLPVKNTVDLNNDYGAINLDRLEGTAKIGCNYGQLIIGELLGDNNYLNFDYTDKSTIAYMKSGKINADYSGFTLEKTEKLELNADYTNSEILEVKSLNYNNDYGKIHVGNAKDVIGQGDYLSHSFDRISGSLNLNADYGSIKIERVTSTAKDITINADYTGVRLAFEAGYSFDFIARLSYASLKGEEDLNVTKSDKDYTSKTYEGYHNIKNSGNKININSSYGGVTFKKI